jgi:hypothetical protein
MRLDLLFKLTTDRTLKSTEHKDGSKAYWVASSVVNIPKLNQPILQISVYKAQMLLLNYYIPYKLVPPSSGN